MLLGGAGFVLFVIWIGCALLCAVIAALRGRSFIGWLIIGLLTGIIGVILAIVLPSNWRRKRTA